MKKSMTVTRAVERFVESNRNKSFYNAEIREWIHEHTKVVISGGKLLKYLKKNKSIKKVQIGEGNIKYLVTNEPSEDNMTLGTMAIAGLERKRRRRREYAERKKLEMIE